jgi:hypothetical protein
MVSNGSQPVERNWAKVGAITTIIATLISGATLVFMWWIDHQARTAHAQTVGRTAEPAPMLVVWWMPTLIALTTITAVVFSYRGIVLWQRGAHRPNPAIAHEGTSATGPISSQAAGVSIAILSLVNGDSVSYQELIYGSVHPRDEFVQVFVNSHSNLKRRMWYVQWQAELRRNSWTAMCTFGEEDVRVQREMESWRAPLASIVPFPPGQFARFSPPKKSWRPAAERSATETATGFKREIRLAGPIHHRGARDRPLPYIADRRLGASKV